MSNAVTYNISALTIDSHFTVANVQGKNINLSPNIQLPIPSLPQNNKRETSLIQAKNKLRIKLPPFRNFEIHISFEWELTFLHGDLIFAQLPH